jgi:hypothetical protein
MRLNTADMWAWLLNRARNAKSAKSLKGCRRGFAANLFGGWLVRHVEDLGETAVDLTERKII